MLDHLLDVLEPGTLTLLVGRPGAGVTTTIARAAKAWSVRGGISVMACWECPASRLRPSFEGSTVLVPDFLGWSVADLDHWLGDAEVRAGALVAVDYLQLLGGAPDTAPALAEMARRLGLRVLLGGMSTPRMTYGFLSPAVLVQHVAADIHSLRGMSVEAIHRMAVLVCDETDGSRRRLTISGKRPFLDSCAASGLLTLPERF